MHVIIKNENAKLHKNILCYVANEGQILRELIYALQGLDGKLFQKDPKDAQSIIIKVEMEKSAKMHVQRHLEFGWLYLRLRKFLATYNNSSNSSSGLVLQVKTQYDYHFSDTYFSCA